MKLEKEYIVNYYNNFYNKSDFKYYNEKISLKFLKVICKICKIKPGSRILDLGCGTGIYTYLFQKLGYESIGIDISETAIKKAKEQYPLSKFEVMDALNLTFDKKYFDVIFLFGCSVVNTDVLEDIDSVFKYLIDYLKNGGYIVYIGGSNLSGKQCYNSEWYNHTLKELKMITYNKSYNIKGPYLTHLRIIYYLDKFGISKIISLILRIKLLNFQRKVIYFIN